MTLSFQKQLERLVVPFAAVRSFADPSVNFALEFAPPEGGVEPRRRPGFRRRSRRGRNRRDQPTGRRRRPLRSVTLDSFRNGAKVFALDSCHCEAVDGSSLALRAAGKRAIGAGLARTLYAGVVPMGFAQ